MNDVQKELKQVMDKIHKHCKENNIKYSLAYGSMLGAIRHEGFIPWDDDIDIFMTRDNYEKFLETFKSNDVIIANERTFPKRGMFTTRVINKNSNYREAVKQKYHYPEGVFVDIFPLDGYPVKWQKFYAFWCNFWDSITYKKSKHNFVSKFGKLIHYLMLIPAQLIPFNFALKHTDKVMRKYNGKSDLLSVTTCRGEVGKIIISKNTADSIIEKKFENTTYYIFKDWEKMLTKQYGNYMKWPNEKDRHGVHFIRK